MLLIIQEDEDDEDLDPGYVSPGSITRALVLALSVCYHARLQDREDYEEGVVKHFIGPINLPGGSEQFKDEIRWYKLKYDRPILHYAQE